MLNFGRIVDVIREELGDAGAESVCGAINSYLGTVSDEEIGCSIDVVVLYALVYAFDINTLNFMNPEFDCLRGRMRRLSSSATDADMFDQGNSECEVFAP